VVPLYRDRSTSLRGLPPTSISWRLPLHTVTYGLSRAGKLRKLKLLKCKRRRKRVDGLCHVCICKLYQWNLLGLICNFMRIGQYAVRRMQCQSVHLCAGRCVWQKDGVTLESSSSRLIHQVEGRSTIHIERPSSRDEGFYQCFASNQFGTAVTVKALVRKASKAPCVYYLYLTVQWR